MNDETRLKDIINKNKHSKAKLYSLVSFGLIIIIGTLSGLSFAYFNTRVSGNDTSATDLIKIKGITIKQATDGALTLINKAPTTTGTINSEGLRKVEQPATEQTPALTEYRYSGSNDTVKNYVTFNGEPWRIIGVFSVDDGTGNYEQRVKIMRNASIGDLSWDSCSININDGYGINEWSQADLKTELNGIYYNRQTGICYYGRNDSDKMCYFSSTGLTEESRNMIDDAKWYTASIDSTGTTAQAYTSERAATTKQFSDGVTRTTSWIGKIALAYLSDYGYASSACYAGSKYIHDYNDSTCTSTNWMFTGSNNKQWLLPTAKYGEESVCVDLGGIVYYSRASYDHGSWPVTYLKSSVNITGGSGTSSDPYTLSL